MAGPRIPSARSKRAAWYAAFESHVLVLRLMDEELRAECGVPLEWYDVLIKVWLAPDHSIRMSELADQVLLSRSWLTRRVQRLERAGLLVRTPDDADGRGVRANMTDRGIEVFSELERSHAASIERHVTRHLSAAEAATVVELFGRISAAATTSLVARAAQPRAANQRPSRPMT